MKGEGVERFWVSLCIFQSSLELQYGREGIFSKAKRQCKAAIQSKNTEGLHLGQGCIVHNFFGSRDIVNKPD